MGDLGAFCPKMGVCMFKRIILVLSLICLYSQSIYSMGSSSSSSSTSSNSAEIIFGSSVAELNQAYENAPARIKNIVSHLKDPNFFSRPTYRSVLIVGVPGIGKSTLAKAIAYQVRDYGWKLEFFSCADLEFAGENRNLTAIKLISTLNEIIDKKEKTIVVIDELNQLLDNYNSKQSDTDMTSKALWTFLDRNRYNQDFFFIGVMNEADKIPKQLKSRHRGRCIEILPVTDLQARVDIFLSKLVDATTKLHSECNENFIYEFVGSLEGWTARDFEEFAQHVVDLYRIENPQKRIKEIRRRHLIEALKEFKDINGRLLKYEEEQETDEERQERQFAQQQYLQLKISAKQKAQWNIGLAGFISRSSAPGLTESEVEQTLDECFTDKQKTILVKSILKKVN